MWLFVYGTLRPGHWNFRMLERAVTECHENAMTTGALYHVGGGSDEHPIYPVAKLDETGLLFGTLLLVDDLHQGVERARRMELGAGYEERTIQVVVGTRTIPAVAFHYRHEPSGPQIASRDWNDIAEQEDSHE